MAARDQGYPGRVSIYRGAVPVHQIAQTGYEREAGYYFQGILADRLDDDILKTVSFRGADRVTVRRFLCVRLLAGAVLVLSLGGEVAAARIGWSYVEGAALYRVEIQNQWGVQVASFETPYIVADVQLAPGTYRLRISVLNKFRKVDAVGEWTPLVVRAGKKIELKEFSPGEFRIGTGDRLLRVTGENFPRDARVRVEGKTVSLLLEIRERSGAGLSALLPSWGLAPGQYSVVVETPDGRRVGKEGLSVEQAPAPEIRDIVPDRFRAGQDVELKISGRYLGPTVTVSLNSRVQGKPVRLPVERDSVRLALKAGTLAPGEYTLEITRADGVRVRESGLRVLAPETTTEAGATNRQTSGTNRSAEDGGRVPCGLKTPWYVGVSLGPADVENNAVSARFYGSAVAEAVLGYRFGAGFAAEAWMAGSGISLDRSSTSGLREMSTFIIGFGLDLFWSPEFDFFLNPWASAGFGLANTTMSIEPESGTAKNLASRDGMMRFALGLRAVLSDNFFIDAGYRTVQIMYPEGGLWLRGPFVRLGIGFGADGDEPTRAQTNTVATNGAPARTFRDEEAGWHCGLAFAEANIGELASSLDFGKAWQGELFGGLSLGSGLEAEISFRMFKARLEQDGTSSSLVEGTLTMAGVSLDMLWNPDLGVFVRPLVGIGVGAVRSGLMLEKAGAVLSDSASYDLALWGSGMLRFEFIPGLRLDAGIRLELINTMGGATVIGGPALRASLRL